MQMEQNKILIITGGSVNQNFLKMYKKNEIFSRIICVDAGLEAADACGLPVNDVVGDFDTVDSLVLEKYQRMADMPGSEIAIHRLKPEKDMTDTHVAIEMALSMQPDEIIIFGATGCRFDHVLANIGLLIKPLSMDVSVSLLDDHNKIYMKNKGFILEKEKAYGNYLSLIPFTECVKDVCLTGVKYELDHYEIKQGESIGISNEIVDKYAKIEFSKGILLVVEAKD